MRSFSAWGTLAKEPGYQGYWTRPQVVRVDEGSFGTIEDRHCHRKVISLWSGIEHSQITRGYTEQFGKLSSPQLQ